MTPPEELIPEDIRNEAITLWNQIAWEDDPSIALARAIMAIRAPSIGDADTARLDSAPAGEAVAWRWRLSDAYPWHLWPQDDYATVVGLSGQGTIEPLYTHPAPPADKQADGLVDLLREARDRIDYVADTAFEHDLVSRIDAALEQASKAGGD